MCPGNGTAWVYEYNDFDQVTRRYSLGTSPGQEFRYFYNSEGRLSRIEQYATTVSGETVTTGARVRTVRYGYDGTGRLVRIREQDAGGVSTAYGWGYDQNDQVTALTEKIGAKSFSSSYSYGSDMQPTDSVCGSVKQALRHDGLNRASTRTLYLDNVQKLKSTYTYRDWSNTLTTTQVTGISGTGDGSMSRFFLTRLLWGSKMRWGDGNAKNREKEKRHRYLPCDAAGNQSSAIV